MDRRDTVLAPLALGAAPFATEAQQPAVTVLRVGYLGSGIGSTQTVDAFRDGLHELGWVDGKNISVDYRFAESRFERLPALAAELVRLKPTVIVAGPTPPALAAKNATGTIPIVIWGVADPVLVGLITSHARPGGNVTGISFAFGTDLYSKELALLKEAVPMLRRVGVLSNSANPGHVPALKGVKASSQSLGLSLQIVEVGAPDEFAAAIDTMAKARAEALLVVPDSLFGLNAEKLAIVVAKRPVAVDVRNEGQCGSRWPAVVWPEPCQPEPAGCDICRQNPQRREARRASGGTAYQVRVSHQPQDRESAWAHHPPVAAVARGRGDSVIERSRLFALRAAIAD